MPDAATADTTGTAAFGLERLATLARETGQHRLAEEATALSARASEGRFYVACVGQFKRGKSTLLDALIGDRVLPTGVVPVTAVPTVVRHGTRRSARVQEDAGSWREIPPETLAEYVSEELNPHNEKGVTGVEVFVPSTLLESGICLVDTPGLGSIFEGNAAATRAFVPHVDAAIVVIGADPPLAGEELILVETIARQVTDLLFVLNKADRVSASERAEATAFARRVLERRLSRAVGRIFEVSAKERLEGIGPPRDWDAFVTRLDGLARQSGRALAATAANRGLHRLARQLTALVAAERESLVRPLEESERRNTALGRTVADAEQALSDLASLFTAEHERLTRTFAERRAAFLSRVRSQAAAELTGRLRSANRRSGPAFRRDAMGLAQDVARRHILPWLESEQREAESAYRRTSERFILLADRFLDGLAATGVPELSHLPHALDIEHGFVTPSRFYFNDQVQLARPASPLRFALDVAFWVLGTSRPIVEDAMRFLDWLLEMNASRVESDLSERVLESRRRLEARIRSLLQEVRTSAERALVRARSAQRAGAGAVDQQLAQLARLERAALEVVPGSASDHRGASIAENTND